MAPCREEAAPCVRGGSGFSRASSSCSAVVVQVQRPVVASHARLGQARPTGSSNACTRVRGRERDVEPWGGG
jgi:hypothetical protein